MKTFFRYKTRSTIYTSQPLQGYSYAAGCLKNGVEASESKITSVCPCMGGTHMLFRDVHFGQFPVPKTSRKGRFTSCLLPICVLSQNLCAWMERKCYFSKRRWQATVKAIFFAIHTTHVLIWLIVDLVCSCVCVCVCVCNCVFDHRYFRLRKRDWKRVTHAKSCCTFIRMPSMLEWLAPSVQLGVCS